MTEETMSEEKNFQAEEFLTDFKLSMWIPADLAGRVVGKKGVVITNLQRETQTRLINALQPVGSSLWVAVVIIGESPNVLKAYKAVSDIVIGEVDGVVAEFTINRRKHSFLLGNRGIPVIKKTSAETNVRIYIPDKETFQNNNGFHGSHSINCSLEGTCEDVYRALELFNIAYKDTLVKQKHWLDSQKESQAREEELSSQQKTVAAESTIAAATPSVSEMKKVEKSSEVPGRWQRVPHTAVPEPAAAAPGRGPTEEKSPEKVIKEAKPTSIRPDVPGTGQQAEQQAAESVPPLPADGASEEAPAPASELQPYTHRPRVPGAFQQQVTVPAALVGLLLVRRPAKPGSFPKNVINLVQSYTQTLIQRNQVAAPAEDSTVATETAAAGDSSGPSRRRRADSHDEDSASSDGDSDSGEPAAPPAGPPRTDVVFCVSSDDEAAAALAADGLRRMVAGDRIKDVLADLSLRSWQARSKEREKRQAERVSRGRPADAEGGRTKGPKKPYPAKDSSKPGKPWRHQPAAATAAVPETVE